MNGFKSNALPNRWGFVVAITLLSHTPQPPLSVRDAVGDPSSRFFIFRFRSLFPKVFLRFVWWFPKKLVPLRPDLTT